MGSRTWTAKVGALVGLMVGLTLSTVQAQTSQCKTAEEQYKRVVDVLHEPAECRYAYTKILSLCPSHVAARVKLADALGDLALQDKDVVGHSKLLDESAQNYEKALTYEKDLVEVYASLGRIYWLQGRYGIARDAYKKALSLKPGDKKIQDSLKTVEKDLAADPGAFRSADKIVGEFRKDRSSNGKMKTMGFKNYTVRKERQQFSNILFEEWSYEIADNKSVAQLEEIGKALGSSQMRDVSFVVEGHTDDRGDIQRNQELSERRAQTVKQFLVEQTGIDPSRILTQGFGYSRPKFPNDSDEHMRQNRRVEIVFR